MTLCDPSEDVTAAATDAYLLRSRHTGSEIARIGPDLRLVYVDPGFLSFFGYADVAGDEFRALLNHAPNVMAAAAAAAAKASSVVSSLGLPTAAAAPFPAPAAAPAAPFGFSSTSTLLPVPSSAPAPAGPVFSAGSPTAKKAGGAKSPGTKKPSGSPKGPSRAAPTSPGLEPT